MAQRVNSPNEEKRIFLDLILRLRNSKDFTDNPSPFTPNRLVKRIIKKILKSKTKSIGVLYTVEFAVELWFQGYKNVTILTKHFCPQTRFIAQRLGYKYYTVNEAKNMGLKFHGMVLNPPYKQGLFREFMQLGLEDLLHDDGVMAQISPDDTDPNNRKNEKTLPLMKKYGLQEMEYCQDDFDVVASAPIHTYYFNKSKPYNPKVFNKTLSPEDQLTKDIVDKILAQKSVVGTLTQKTVGNLPEKGNPNLVTALSTVTKDGPVWEDLPLDKVRYVNNGQDYFFTNRFFGMNKYDFAYKGVGPLYISSRVYCIGNAVNYSEKDFNKTFNCLEVKFLLKIYRGTNTFTKGWSIREIPLIPAGTTDTSTFFGLTQKEKDHILNVVG